MHSKTRTVSTRNKGEKKIREEKTCRNCEWSSCCGTCILHLNEALRTRCTDQFLVFVAQSCWQLTCASVEKLNGMNWCERFTIETCVLWRRDTRLRRILAVLHKSNAEDDDGEDNNVRLLRMHMKKKIKSIFFISILFFATETSSRCPNTLCSFFVRLRY